MAIRAWALTKARNNTTQTVVWGWWETGGGGGWGWERSWQDQNESTVIMVILPPCYYCLYCMRSGCENSSIRDRVIDSRFVLSGLAWISVLYSVGFLEISAASHQSGETQEAKIFWVFSVAGLDVLNTTRIVFFIVAVHYSDETSW